MLLRILGTGLLWATAGIHLDLYLTGYNTIPTIGWLFLLQVIVGLALGLLVLLTGNRLVAAAGALFALSTLGGYLLTVQFGLFGFKEIRTTAGIWAGIFEVAAFAVLAVYAVLDGVPGLDAMRGMRARSGSAGPAGREASSTANPAVPARLAGLGVAAVCVVALALFGGALAANGAPSSSGSSNPAATGQLRTEQIGGVKVLANSAGRTLYWFAPDSSTKSVCNGGCAAYWPPVHGAAKASGIPGTFATITRADGSIQATYNGHPLYTYIGDSGPGQAHGNNITLNGGLWHEVTVSG
jgi:predicted lipoprotein with Yx(FWY)xxD motif